MSYDPIEDEKKEFTLEEWVDLIKDELDSYVKVWKDQNEFHMGKHTWTVWLNSFIQYMSW